MPIKDPSLLRDEFERLVQQWTGHDMEYHARAGTTGLEFAWYCFKKGRGTFFPTQERTDADVHSS